LAGAGLMPEEQIGLFIAGNVSPSEKYKRNLIVHQCHPIDIATVMHAFPDFVQQTVACDFPQNDEYANFRMEVRLVAEQNSALLGTITGAEIPDAEKVTAFANYFASNPEYYDRIGKSQPQIAALESWTESAINDTAGRRLNKRDLARVYKYKLTEIGKASREFIYTHERLEDLLEQDRLDASRARITRQDITNALGSHSGRQNGNRSSRRRR
jgi:hypothetical protein